MRDAFAASLSGTLKLLGLFELQWQLFIVALNLAERQIPREQAALARFAAALGIAP